MDLEKVLTELNAEKRWLDAVIGALETAAKSPAHRLIRTLDQSLGHRRRGRPRLAPRTRAELDRLARQVRQTEGASRGTGRPA